MGRVSVIAKTLTSLDEMLKGAVAPTPDLERLATISLQRRIPHAWEKAFEHGPADPISLVTDAISRCCAAVDLNRRLFTGGNDAARFAPGSVNLRTFLNVPLPLAPMVRPATFLNALRQDCAMALDCAVNDRELTSDWAATATIDAQMQHGFVLIISSCFLEGAKLGMSAGNVKLQDLDSSDPALAVVPNLRVAWLPSSQLPPTASSFSVPLYADLSRTGGQLASLRVPVSPNVASTTTSAEGLWQLRSVALFLGTD
eukprot:Clim_evm3s196 gene=Clim_evmTU3s196